MFVEWEPNAHSSHTMKSGLSPANGQLCLQCPHWRRGRWRLSSQREGGAKARVWTLSLAWQLPSMPLARRWLGNPGLTDCHWASLIKGVCVSRPDTSVPGACKASWYAAWHRQFPVSCCGQRSLPAPTPQSFRPAHRYSIGLLWAEGQQMGKEH